MMPNLRANTGNASIVFTHAGGLQESAGQQVRTSGGHRLAAHGPAGAGRSGALEKLVQTECGTLLLSRCPEGEMRYNRDSCA